MHERCRIMVGEEAFVRPRFKRQGARMDILGNPFEQARVLLFWRGRRRIWIFGNPVDGDFARRERLRRRPVLQARVVGEDHFCPSVVPPEVADEMLVRPISDEDDDACRAEQSRTGEHEPFAKLHDGNHLGKSNAIMLQDAKKDFLNHSEKKLSCKAGGDSRQK